MSSYTVFKGSESGQIVESKIEKPDIKPDEVLIKVTHAGLCGTDVHFKKADLVLGHEGVGLIEAIGPNVKHLKEGDRVCWGFLRDCCGTCKKCLSGSDHYCPERMLYGFSGHDRGSFASHTVCKEDFVFKIPDKISSENAAPLNCAGLTVYNALQTYPVKAGDRIGILGMGGLGQLAIEFAVKMGCEVVVFSRTSSKKDEALAMGAREFYATEGVTELKLEGGKLLDRLLITATGPTDWALYMPLMVPQGSLYPLQYPEGMLEIPHMPLAIFGLRVQGEVIGSRQAHRDMLDFAAAQDIKPVLQTFPMTRSGVEEAFGIIESGSMRYRGVLVAQ